MTQPPADTPLVIVPPGVAGHWAVRELLAPYVRITTDSHDGADGRITVVPTNAGDIPDLAAGHLPDPRWRDAFCTAVFAYRRVRQDAGAATAMRDLQALHAREKYLLMAHDPGAYRMLGRMVAGHPTSSVTYLAATYRVKLCAALAVPAPRPRHVAALQHMAGYFKRGVDTTTRREIHAMIVDFKAGIAPLPAVLTVIREAAERAGRRYIMQQTYVRPQPWPLLLRNWL